MILPVLFQGGLFLGAVAAGLIMAFCYDIFRVARRIVPHSALLIHIEDIIYWVITAAALFYLMLRLNGGEIRFFPIAGVFIGMLIYFRFISRFFLGVSLAIYDALRKTVIIVVNMISAPIKVLLRILSIPIRFFAGKVKTAYCYEKGLYRGVKMKNRYRAKKVRNNFKIIFKNI